MQIIVTNTKTEEIKGNTYFENLVINQACSYAQIRMKTFLSKR